MSLIYFLDIFGSFAFALSGALMAIKKDMDIFGMMVLALVTAIGGGTIRDVLLGNTPVFILNEPIYIYLSMVAAVCAFLFHRFLFRINSVILVADALGLGTFVCIGISKGLEADVSAAGAVILGVITAVVGGMIRDVLSNEIPAVLIKDFYAITCIVGGIVYILLHNQHFAPEKAMVISSVFIIGLRLMAIKFNWSLIRVTAPSHKETKLLQ